MTADTEKEQVSSQKNTHCLICNCRIAVSTRNSCNIFHKSITLASEHPLPDIIGRILGQELQEGTVHSNLICKKCFKLIYEVDEIETRLEELKNKLNTNYQQTLKMYHDVSKTSSYLDNLSSKKAQARITKNTFDDDAENENIENEQDSFAPERTENLQEKEHLAVEDLHDEVCDNGLTDVIIAEDDTGHDPSQSNAKMNMEPEEFQKEVLRKKNGVHITPEQIVGREGVYFICLLCNSNEKIMGDRKGIVVHLKDIHNIRIFICDICLQCFIKRNDLSEHLDNHVATVEGHFQCEACGDVFDNIRLFEMHKRLHVPQIKQWTCETCGKSYNSRNLLDEHINTHIGVRPYVCEVCGKDFASKYSYRSHTKTHEARKRPFSCGECGKMFLRAQNLTQHEQMHAGVHNYVCDQCGKSFATSRNLEVHSVVHSGYKPFACQTCGKTFTRKAEMQNHERTHTGEKPYQCEFCGATFSQRSNLQSHKRATHYQDKRYKCLNCDKGFKRQRLLDYHIKAAHTGERPFKCTSCSATFIYPHHFKKHHRLHLSKF